MIAALRRARHAVAGWRATPTPTAISIEQPARHVAVARLGDRRVQPNLDTFVVEQIAGDLLPGATREQKIASGFNRNYMINFEGGAILRQEYRVEYVMDRVESTSSAFMGLTMAAPGAIRKAMRSISHKSSISSTRSSTTCRKRGSMAAPATPSRR